MTIEFRNYPKTPRLFRDCIITEKIDGTNAAIIVTDDGKVGAQSRNRLIHIGQDNMGFAAWVNEHQQALVDILGPGYHYGEWWGSGIQRGYGLEKGKKRFSLFNTHRWENVDLWGAVPGLGNVPVLYKGPFTEVAVRHTLNALVENGSQAAPGFMQPEGVIVFHAASRQTYKVLAEDDHLPKGLVA